MTTYLNSPRQATKWCERQRQDGRSLGYVPTMGALHEGHRSLVERSVSENDVTCVSIFVNPLQFNSTEDLENYPQTLEEDMTLLKEVGCQMVFSGTSEEFFQERSDVIPDPPIEPLPAIVGLEAEFRPGHLNGVQAIVEQLFAIVGPCRAYFGEKDFQQTLLVRQIAQVIGDIDVIVCRTVRESGGLAFSSRNQRLDDTERELARNLYRTLGEAKQAWQEGETDPKKLENLMWENLSVPGISLEYAAVRDSERWTAETPEGPISHGRALVAAWVGQVRLIDNIDLGILR